MNISKVLYANFLADKRVYNLAQAYWKRFFDRLAEANGFSYKSYINQLQDGKKEYDGNPIFSAYVPAINRAVRIIQVAPEDGAMEISAWVDSIELKTRKPPAQELVLEMVLSKEARKAAKSLVEGWLVELISEKEVNDHFS